MSSRYGRESWKMSDQIVAGTSRSGRSGCRSHEIAEVPTPVFGDAADRQRVLRAITSAVADTARVRERGCGYVAKFRLRRRTSGRGGGSEHFCP